jgi:hypothetical protein
VTFTPSGFERFFQEIERRRLLAGDVAELRALAGGVGMDILGPPLSDEEVRQIIVESEKRGQSVRSSLHVPRNTSRAAQSASPLHPTDCLMRRWPRP